MKDQKDLIVEEGKDYLLVLQTIYGKNRELRSNPFYALAYYDKYFRRNLCVEGYNGYGEPGTPADEEILGWEELPSLSSYPKGIL